ncbi:MAG: BRCT domain-containing protein [Bacteroidales bacterium]
MSKEISQLRNLIQVRNKEYREGNPTITDKEYDLLVDRLKELSPDDDWFSKIEPVEGVSPSRKSKLPCEMRSLFKKKSIDDVYKWLDKYGLPKGTELLILPKYDGISILVDESNGMCWTRGGESNEGMESPDHYAMMGVESDTLATHTGGEAIISNENWKKHFADLINPATGEKYRSPRNLVAGLFRRDDVSDLLRHVDFVRYMWVGSPDPNNQKFSTKMWSAYSRYNNKIPLFFLCKAQHLTHDSLQMLYNKWSDDYAIDGVVIYVNDMRIWERMGRCESTGNPNYAIAYKGGFESTINTTVISVNGEVSKNGYLRPTVSVEPVFIDGCVINNPTGYNYKFIVDMNIAPGATVTLKRSGSVIPKIIGCENLNNTPVVIPTTCPACGDTVSYNDTGTDLVCVNKSCCGRLLSKVIHFYETMKCDGLGDSFFTAVFNIKGLTRVHQFLDLTEEELTAVPGVGPATIALFLDINNRIKNNKHKPELLMHAFDTFDGIGEKRAKLIINQMSDSDKELMFEHHIGSVEITPTKGVGEKIIDAFYNGVEPFVDLLESADLKCDFSDTALKTNNLKDYIICFTDFRDSDLEAKIVSHGGVVTASLSKKTTLLLVASMESTTTKAKKARELGTKMMLVDDFKASMAYMEATKLFSLAKINL